MKLKVPDCEQTIVAPPPDVVDLNKTIVGGEQGIGGSRLEKIGPYEIVDFIGFGGSGMVYRAVDANHAEVAVKIMTVNPFVSKLDIRRFLSEAETSKKLRKHPNIITVYETGQDGNDFYIAMELVKGGRSFKDLIAAGVTIEKALELLIPVADALAYAHSEGILHRDIKPANILVNDFGQPLLADFGLAKSETADRMTMTGSVIGTPRYMSPEQAGFGDGVTTKQSDIYSFGLVAYELITGRLPYPLEDGIPLPEIFRIICSQEPIPPREIKKEISRNLEAVLLRMLEKEKSLRYKEMAQVCADLKACKEGKPVSVRKLTWAEKFEKSVRKNLPIALTTFVLLIIGILIYLIFLRPSLLEKIYAKQESDLSAVAEKHKTAALEQELKQLKGENSLSVEETKIHDAYKKAVSLLRERKLDDAQTALLEISDYAEKNSHPELLAECNANLARIKMAQGKYNEAIKLFDAALVFHGENNIKGELDIFESGVASLLDGATEAASQRWQRVVSASRLDSKFSCDYICLSAEIMLDEKNLENGIEAVKTCPTTYKGILCWAIAQKTHDCEIRKKWLEEARANAGVFAWIANTQ